MSRCFKTFPWRFKVSMYIPHIRWEGHFRVLSKLVELKALLRSVKASGRVLRI